MPTIDEKRVYDARTGTTRALVASTIGVVRVEVSDDIVGEFGIEHRCTARDLATAGDALAVATDEDVLVGGFEPTDHGPAVAVGVDGDATFAAAPDGTVSRLVRGADEWEALGEVEEPRRMAGSLVAAADGVHRVRGGVVEYVGLDDVRDVAAGGVPLAVTGEALYTLGNGWMRDLQGDFRAVATDAAGERAVAATPEEVYERADDGVEWDAHPEAGVVDAAVASELLVAVTDGGEIRVHAAGAEPGDGGADAGSPWRGRHIGVPDGAAVVLPGSGSTDGGE
ncbi:hypothetical protein HUG10_13815 [Halorarum halophilum]|uniref:HVO-0234-like beta-propeller domain-containing protein n=1 Tax=Halorarum halophilum TaxID=2743090 RepID=A0A7D5KMP8_9EURY|nr:hypothetical protein [Halobaculum halophilum]QLG28555.1 hypothetical protein HUG10_13815 [Halobaculum halophilum]